MGKTDKKAWIIAYINSKFLSKLRDDLAKYPEFKEVEAFVPTVKLLKKQFKGKREFEEIPLLFNYGFFKIPNEQAMDPAFLSRLRTNIGCIFGWVRDPIKTMKDTPNLRLGNDYEYEPRVDLAFAKDEEIARLMEVQSNLSVYSGKDTTKLKKGDIITLYNYPFDGLPAKVLFINKQKEEVKVSLLLEAQLKEVNVSFDNIFYSVYRAYDPDDTKHQSLDEIRDNENKTFDKLLLKLLK